MIFRSRAPLRLGLAGGGTDVSPYSDIYGGAVLNATISMFAYATIEPRDDNKIVFNAIDRNEKIEIKSSEFLEIDDNLDLLKGIYNRIVKDFTKKPLAFELSTYVDAPAGSGLGSSSTLVVAVIGAFAEWLKLPLGEYDIAHLAFEIERKDLNMAGGKQDQYAATFGGFNFMEFYENDKVIVNPLRIKSDIINELQFNILLYYTGTSRLSSKIIEAQVKNVYKKEEKSVEAMHKLKEQAIMMKEAILKGKLDEIGEILDYGWQYKKQMAEGITNSVIDEIYETAKKAGATGGKISGAGGGGFMMFYCPKNTRYKVIESLQPFGGEFRRFQFTKYGLESWRV
ncbi:dehydrogenase [Venenivibrio stagnispumantis]|uniref:D-glycero-alpha-D-manno-heptose-7-phosphate kinase n=1 Tax=Venenivibrio stagnispumantis TaxID=407998 RepID=A0AA45WN89_9AQUI|nr:GHMP kinase [Venenivibrio stagnispumantis]MCW4573213.1 GHMP kinase [Venenivibrio stagnispumantis]SMP17265.1 D-glycero-alpha-D-manno-heptose-7-phosphate kinase [Venenivibrio stagnispumantis]